MKKNKKKTFAIIGIIILLIILCFILLISMSKDNRQERKMKQLGKIFYSYYYEEKVDKKDKDKVKVYMSNYADTGLTISLKDLKVYLDTHKIENYSALNTCDESKTKVTVYPVSPYGKKDYKIKTNLNCK